MAQQTINIGTAPDDGTGDTARDGGDKINDNFTEVYSHTDSTKLNEHGDDAIGGGPYSFDGDLDITGHMAAGTDAAVTDRYVIEVEENLGDLTNPSGGMRLIAAADDLGGQILAALRAEVVYEGSDIGAGGKIVGADYVVAHGVGGTMTEASALTASVVNFGGGSIQSAVGALINTSNIASTIGVFTGVSIGSVTNTGTITNGYGFSVGSMGANTLNIGVRVAKQTGATTNIGFAIVGDDVGADLVLGAAQDAAIYYDGTDLIIDPDLITAGDRVLIGVTGDDDMLLNDIEIDGDLNHDGTNAGFYGTAPITKPTALTAADATALDGTIGTNDTVTDNLRTRLNELESKIQALGLLT